MMTIEETINLIDLLPELDQLRLEYKMLQSRLETLELENQVLKAEIEQAKQDADFWFSKYEQERGQ